jgi:uncharacterized alkaline shock family protein YloU
MREIATPEGRLVLTESALAAVAAAAALRHPGVVALAGRRLPEGLGWLRDVPDPGRRGAHPGPGGVEVHLDAERCVLALDLVVVYGARLEEVRSGAAAAVAAAVAAAAGFPPDAVEVRVVGVRRGGSSNV